MNSSPAIPSISASVKELLTERQLEVLEMITQFRAIHGFAPSTRDIQKHFGFASQTAAMSHLRALRSKGAVGWSPRRSRTVNAEGVVPVPVPSPVFTYIFHDSVSGKVKIGRASDVESRKHNLEVGYPCKLTTLVLLPTAEWPEKEVHAMFKPDRIRGEWFEYSDAIKSFVSTHAAAA